MRRLIALAFLLLLLLSSIGLRYRDASPTPRARLGVKCGKLLACRVKITADRAGGQRLDV